ncbi:hypothetical protein [Polaribacter sp.]|uniref:hypothetical protein n=1 Tax=Polaribacter sp. TaxID=1920175 RepID=UPI003EF69246
MKIKNLKLILTIGIFVFSCNSFAQTQKDSIQEKKVDTLEVTKDKKWQFGLGFGLNFVGGTNINISPNLTYNLSNKIAFGMGIQYNYLALKDIQKTTTYGANAIFMYKPSQKIITLLEFAQLRVTSKSEIDNSKRKFWDSALFIGAGYNITNKITLGAKYNFLYDKDQSIYSSPIIPFVTISF